MAVFGRYESMQELSRSPFGSVYSARPVGEAGASASFIIKTFNPRGLDVEELKADPDVKRFLERVEVQQKAAASGSLHWAPIIESGVAREGAYYVSKFYPSSAARLIKGKVRLEPVVLHSIVRNTLEGLRELKACCNQAHGNINPQAILLDRRDKTGYGDIVLAEPATAREAQKAGGAANDMAMLGEVIYQMITHRPWVGASGWPIKAGPEWTRMGARGRKWLDLTNKLLDPSAKDDVLNIDAVAKDVHRLRVGKRLLSLPAVALILLVALGAGGSVGWVKYRNWKNDWTTYCDEYQWFKQFATNYDRGGSLQRLLTDNADLKRNILDVMEDARARGVHFDLKQLTGRVVPDEEQKGDVPLSMKTARETREALRLVRQMRKAWEESTALNLTKLDRAWNDWRKRGWESAAKYLEDTAVSARLGVGDAIDAALDVQDSVGGIEEMWQQVEAHRAKIDGAKSAMLSRYGAIVSAELKQSNDVKGRPALLMLANALRSARDEGQKVADRLVPEKLRVLNRPAVEEWERTQAVTTLEHLHAWPAEVLTKKKYWINLGPDPRKGFEPEPAIAVLSKQLPGFDDAAKELGTRKKKEADAAAEIAATKSAYRARIEQLDKLVRELKAMDWQNPEEEDEIRGALAKSQSELARLTDELPKTIAGAKSKARQIRLESFQEVVDDWKKAEIDKVRFPVVAATWARQRDAMLAVVNPDNLNDVDRRLTGLRELLDKLDKDPALAEPIKLPRREGVAWNDAVEAALEAVAAAKRQDILVKTLGTLEVASATPSVQMPVWNQQFEQYKAWVAGASRFLESYNRIGDLLDLAYGSAEAAPDGQTIAKLLDAGNGYVEDPAVSRAVAPLGGRLAELRQFEAPNPPDALLAALKRAPGVQNAAVMRAAWLNLRKSGWPANHKDLPRVVEVGGALRSSFDVLADKARGAALVKDVDDFRLAALRKALLSGADPASVEEALKAGLALKGQLGLSEEEAFTDGELNRLALANEPAFRFNYALFQYRKSPVADKARDAEAQPRVQALLAALPSTPPAGTEEFRQVLDALAKEKPSNEDPATAAPEAGPSMGPTKAAWGKPKVDKELMTFTSERPKRTLTFVRVAGATVNGKVVAPYYLSTGEVSIGLVADLMRLTNVSASALGLPSKLPPESPAAWRPATLAQTPFWYDKVVYTTNNGITFSRYAPSLVDPKDPMMMAEPEDNPSREHPINHLNVDAAMTIAAMLGCRLPTSDEWRAARLRQTHPANLRDATWRKQDAHTDALRSDPEKGPKIQVYVYVPYANRFVPPGRVSETARAWTADELVKAGVPKGSDDDKTVFFRRATYGNEAYSHLVGNVAEYTWDDPKGFMELKDRSLGAVQAYLGRDRGADLAAVAGGSAFGPPEFGLGPHPVKFAELRENGYSDVGFRLAFPAGRRTIADRLKEAVENQPYLATATQ